MVGMIIGILTTLLLSALFSGMEIAFVSAGKLNIEIIKQSGTRRGRILARFFDNPNDFLSAMLVGNNISLVLFSLLLGNLLGPRMEPFLLEVLPGWYPQRFVSVLPLTLITTIVVLVFGEFLPKIFFRLFSDRILYSLAYPVALLKWLLAPLSWLMVNLSERFLALFFKAPDDEASDAFTRNDLARFVESTRGEDSGGEALLDKKIFGNVLEMKQTRVRSCIVPRNEVMAVEVNDSIEELQAMFVETSKSKIIIYKDSIEQVIGYVHHQSMLTEPKSIRAVMRPITIVPEAMWIQDLLGIFIRDRSSIAYVVDEFGRTSGIITMEDILEEIFGEIEDEHDEEDDQLIEEQLSSGEYRFSGRLEIDYLNETYPHLDFEEGEYITLSGYIVMTQGNIPEKGARIDIKGYRFFIEEVSKTKVETTRVEILDRQDLDE